MDKLEHHIIPRIHVDQPQIIASQIVVPVLGEAPVRRRLRGRRAEVAERIVARNPAYARAAAVAQRHGAAQDLS